MFEQVCLVPLARLASDSSSSSLTTLSSAYMLSVHHPALQASLTEKLYHGSSRDPCPMSSVPLS